MKMSGQELLETALGLEKAPGICWIQTILSCSLLACACWLIFFSQEPRINGPEHSGTSAWEPGYGARGHGHNLKPSAVMNNATKSPWSTEQEQPHLPLLITPYLSCSGRLLWSFLTRPPAAQTRQINSNRHILVSHDSFLWPCLTENIWYFGKNSVLKSIEVISKNLETKIWYHNYNTTQMEISPINGRYYFQLYKRKKCVKEQRRKTFPLGKSTTSL